MGRVMAVGHWAAFREQAFSVGQGFSGFARSGCEDLGCKG